MCISARGIGDEARCEATTVTGGHNDAYCLLVLIGLLTLTAAGKTTAINSPRNVAWTQRNSSLTIPRVHSAMLRLIIQAGACGRQDTKSSRIGGRAPTVPR